MLDLRGRGTGLREIVRILTAGATHYQVLGVARSTPIGDTQTFTSAYKRVIRVAHPDSPGAGAAAAATRLNEANDTLSDVNKRRYDQQQRGTAAASPSPRTSRGRRRSRRVLRRRGPGIGSRGGPMCMACLPPAFRRCRRGPAAAGTPSAGGGGSAEATGARVVEEERTVGALSSAVPQLMAARTGKSSRSCGKRMLS